MAKEVTTVGGGGGVDELPAEFVVQGGGVVTVKGSYALSGVTLKAEDIAPENIKPWVAKGRLIPVMKPLVKQETKSAGNNRNSGE